MSDASYRVLIEEQERLEEEALRIEEEVARKRREEWLEKDLQLHALWLKKKQTMEKALEEQNRKEELLKKEWEENIRKEEEEKSKKLEEKEALLRKATSCLGSTQEMTHNPEPPPGRARKYKEVVVEPCPFFNKTGACRYGALCSRIKTGTHTLDMEYCSLNPLITEHGISFFYKYQFNANLLSREHKYPTSSQTVLLTNMYSHIGLDGELIDDYDTDISLEYSESERYNHYREFYYDVLPEFEKCGRVIQFKVCCNKSSHLRGNVYVQYAQVESAVKAVTKFNGRWYAGKQISCIFVPIERWKSAICGLHWSHKCPKGNLCNFLHVYRNPGNAFYSVDVDYLLRKNHQSSSRSQSNSNQREDAKFSETKDSRSVPKQSTSKKSVPEGENKNHLRRDFRKDLHRDKFNRSRNRSRERKRSRSDSHRSRERRKKRKASRSRSRSREKNKENKRRKVACKT
ncbi:U2 small nuclear ribonucleoprotein auxiliary factor subunit-related protein 1 [Armadillidium nasatum]|uniref:U2 small nuclear ribonucleoprotein auxiliary factor subunit-related protein 1 n=1 Tax=Armadillidium nasatum TaxID=96803 RepID=A0A5N5TJQ0_9CRUS|nr:U2 small nuclear ribonucleoprotein auxiliary factor subunit-related protein 1 [Armadillidium nasatum]